MRLQYFCKLFSSDWFSVCQKYFDWNEWVNRNAVSQLLLETLISIRVSNCIDNINIKPIGSLIVTFRAEIQLVGKRIGSDWYSALASGDDKYFLFTFLKKSIENLKEPNEQWYEMHAIGLKLTYLRWHF